MTPNLAMPIIWTLIAIWVLGIVVMIGRLWYFQIIMFNNLAPGRSPWELRGGGFFDASRYNATGREAHRKMLRLIWKVMTFGVGMPILIGIAGSLMF